MNDINVKEIRAALHLCCAMKQILNSIDLDLLLYALNDQTEMPNPPKKAILKLVQK